MKNQIAVSILFIFYTSLTFSQAGVSISPDNSAPNASAMLDIQSTTKGTLIPRLSTLQRGAIASPAPALLVYDSDTKSFWFYKETGWINVLTGNSGWTTTMPCILSYDIDIVPLID